MYVKQVHELCPLTLRYEVTTQQWIQDRLYSIHFLYDQSFPKPDSQFQGCCKVGILKEGKAHHSESSDCYYMKKQFWFWQNLFLFKWNTRTRYFLFNWNRVTGIFTVNIYTNSCWFYYSHADLLVDDLQSLIFEVNFQPISSSRGRVNQEWPLCTLNRSTNALVF